MASSGRTSSPRPPLFDRRAVLRGVALTARRLLAVVVAVLAIFLAAVTAVPLATGGSSFTVDAESEPTVLADGSLAFVRPIRIGAIEAGDVLATTEAVDGTATRRVVAVTRDDVILVEAFDGTGSEPLDRTLVDGEVWLHLRSLGTVRDALANPLALVALAGTAVVLAVRLVLDRRSASRARAERPAAGAAGAATSPPAVAEPPAIRVQVLLALVTKVDDVMLRFALAEMGGSVVGAHDDRTRLVRLVGTPAELDRAEARLAEIGRIDAVRRSDELSMPVPAPGRSTEAA
ncbi:MAG: hypothetical protein AAGF02_11365 [Actinomycetota bacterium]